MTDTPVAREARLTAQRESTRMARLADTHDEREARLATDRIQAQQRNPNQTAEQTQVTRSIAQRKLKQNKAAKRDEFWYRAAFTYDPAKNYANNNKVTIGKMDKICSSCGAKKWDFDVPGLCCSQGKVRLPPLPDPPQALLELLTSPSDGAKHFRERIHRRKRSNLSNHRDRVRKSKRREAHARRQRSRMTDTPVAREARLTAQRESTRMARLADTHDEREARLATDRIQAQQRNPNQTAEQTQVTRSIAQRKLKQNKAAKRDEFWYRAAFTYDPAKNYANNNKVTIGKMDKICSSCGAKMWDFDVPGLCCSQGKVRLPPLPDPPQVLLELLTSPSDGAKHFRERIHRFNSCFSMTCFGTTSIPGLQKNKNKQNMPRPSNVASTTTENLSVPGPSWTVTTTITENLNVPRPSRAVAKTVLENPHVDRHSTKPNYHSEKYEHFYTYKIHGQCYHQMGSLRPIPGKEPTFMQVFFVGGHDEELAIRKKNNPKLERRVIEVLQMMRHQTHPYVQSTLA
ncbi:Hypothetical predicted protein [Octopus vulgaris]|uniref:Uncharacterized protein n=1 Tax=Octopus vulgaris TaxID=6645 RepID=A0AA36C2M3_OCTVU|nr:Hypothetical predicted protein [Octopus vulgaris]